MTAMASQSDKATGSSAPATNSRHRRQASLRCSQCQERRTVIDLQKPDARPTYAPLLARMTSSRLDFWVICGLDLPSAPGL